MKKNLKNNLVVLFSSLLLHSIRYHGSRFGSSSLSLFSGSSSAGRARPCQGRGRAFESRLPLCNFKFQTPPVWNFLFSVVFCSSFWELFFLGKLKNSCCPGGEMVDTRDLKSLSPQWLCRFESGPGHFSPM